MQKRPLIRLLFCWVCTAAPQAMAVDRIDSVAIDALGRRPVTPFARSAAVAPDGPAAVGTVAPAFAMPVSSTSASSSSGPSAGPGPALKPAGLPKASARAAASGPIVSEVLADPASVSDAAGEFIELGNPGADTLRLDTLRVDVNGTGTVLRDVRMPPNGLFLICRDSVDSVNGGLPCARQWSGMSLANGKSLAVALSWQSGAAGFNVPASRAGVSWENTWDASAGFAVFQASMGSWRGDSATPGYRNSRSLVLAARDLGITQVTWDRAGFAQVTIESRGTEASVPTWMSLRLDADWDGEAESLLDSENVVVNGRVTLRIPLPAGARGLLQARIGGDEDPTDDVFRLPLEEEMPLAISEWRDDPDPGEPEWAEVFNRTGKSGTPRAVALRFAAFDGAALAASPGATGSDSGSAAGGLGPAARLEAGAFLVLTESLEKFRAHYGPIQAQVAELPGWKSLRNTGDTLALDLAGFPCDRVIYGSDGRRVIADATANAAGPGNEASAQGEVPSATSGGGPDSRLSDLPGGQGWSPSPGYAGDAEPPGWSVSARVTSALRPLDVDIRIPQGKAFALRAFDLEGNCVARPAAGGSGRHAVSWDGGGAHGRLHPGPYILCLTVDGWNPLKLAVIVEDR